MCKTINGDELSADDLFRAVKQAVRDGNHLPPAIVSQVSQWLGECAVRKLAIAERGRGSPWHVELKPLSPGWSC